MLLRLQPDSLTVPHWRQQRPSLFIQSCQRSAADASNDTCCLSLEGYVRHRALSVNQIISISFHGDYAIESITPLAFPRGHLSATTCSEGSTVYPDPSLQESLIRENAYAVEEEMVPVDEGRFEDAVQQTTRHVPKGTSAYQAAWIPDDLSSSDSDSDATSEKMQTASDEDDAEDLDAIREAHSVGAGAFTIEYSLM